MRQLPRRYRQHPNAHPHALYATRIIDPLNLSTYGEWRYSMMALAGRDPIFLAQLDTESTVHYNIKGKPNASRVRSGYVFILPRSNGTASVPPGQRKRTRHVFTRDQLQDPTSPYGALARDGVSCKVCHHMADKDLDDPSTYTGKFIVGPANVVYGPYPSGDSDVKVGDNVIPRPMKNSVGIVPVFGAQVGEAKLCASCHTIVLPVYDAHGNQVRAWRSQDRLRADHLPRVGQQLLCQAKTNVPELPYAR